MRAFRVTTRGVMLVVAFIALLGGLVFRVLEDDVDLRNEIRARMAVVGAIDEEVREADRRVRELSAWIDESDRRAIRHPEHRSWVASRASWRSTRAKVEGLRAHYRRLAWFPWIDLLPDSRYGETYRRALRYDPSARGGRAVERGYSDWSMTVAFSVATLAGGLLALVGGFVAGRGASARVVPRSFARAWLPRLCGGPSASLPAKRDR